MEDFTSDEFHIKLLNKPPPCFSDLNSNNIDLLTNLSDQLHQPLISSHHVLNYLSTDGYLTHPENLAATVLQVPQQSIFTSFDHGNAGDYMTPASAFAGMASSPGLGSESGGNYLTDKKDSASMRKRKRKTMEVQEDKANGVVHVRAKRGQATDSHSLAERVRRERINEKLKVLQDLVPGCYKTMGMAVMLEVIINYVRSLQNQIEFLSMKISAASMFYDFNSPEAEAIEALQRAAAPYEGQETEMMAREGYGGNLPRLHSTWPF